MVWGGVRIYGVWEVNEVGRLYVYSYWGAVIQTEINEILQQCSCFGVS